MGATCKKVGHATTMEQKIKTVQQKFDNKRTIPFASSFPSSSKSISLPGLSRPQSQISSLRKKPGGRVTINNSPNRGFQLDVKARNRNFPCSGGHGCEDYSHTAEDGANTGRENCVKYLGAAGDVEKMYWQLNDVFAQRLKDIAKSVDDNKELKLATYQDWTDILLKINDSIVANTKQLEFELAEHLQKLRQFNAQRREELIKSLTKSRRDLHSLKGEWDFNIFQNVSFETISLAQILGVDDPTNVIMKGRRAKIKRDLELMEERQLLRNIKALAIELAEKNAEIEVLRREMACVEDQIDYSWGKLQIKNETIEQLQKSRKSDVLKVSKSYVHTFLLGALTVLSGKF
uniref:Uncharacterized protein n=1 Tax=Glossina austeni TaxID=7395 RepID=A0A1A9UZR6_GLOAU